MERDAHSHSLSLSLSQVVSPTLAALAVSAPPNGRTTATKSCVVSLFPVPILRLARSHCGWNGREKERGRRTDGRTDGRTGNFWKGDLSKARSPKPRQDSRGSTSSLGPRWRNRLHPVVMEASRAYNPPYCITYNRVVGDFPPSAVMCPFPKRLAPKGGGLARPRPPTPVAAAARGRAVEAQCNDCLPAVV